MPRTHDEHGAVTAETAMTLPVLAVVTLALAWMVSLGVTHVRAVDAARETARSLARGDGTAQAVALGRRVAPGGSRIRVVPGEGTVTVEVAVRPWGPGRLLGSLTGLEVGASAVAATEPTS